MNGEMKKKENEHHNQHLHDSDQVPLPDLSLLPVFVEWYLEDCWFGEGGE